MTLVALIILIEYPKSYMRTLNNFTEGVDVNRLVQLLRVLMFFFFILELLFLIILPALPYVRVFGP